MASTMTFLDLPFSLKKWTFLKGSGPPGFIVGHITWFRKGSCRTPRGSESYTKSLYEWTALLEDRPSPTELDSIPPSHTTTLLLTSLGSKPGAWRS